MSAKQPQPQQHLLPKQNTAKSSAPNNELDKKKRQYIIEMRKGLCDKNIIQPDGSLNLKYFNVKKGHYWSEEENTKLIKAVLDHGPSNIRKIKKDQFPTWTETEIRLRICRLLKCYNLKDYEGRMFADEDELMEEAKRNKKEAIDRKAMVGGILYNPPPIENEDYFGCKSKSKKQ